MGGTFKSENRIQQECVMWFNNTFPYLRGCLFAVPNGGTRTAREGKLLKETGVWAGVSDMLFMFNSKTTCFELKTIKGYQSDKQLAWEATMKKQGFDYYIIRDLDEFKYHILNITNGTNR